MQEEPGCRSTVPDRTLSNFFYRKAAQQASQLRSIQNVGNRPIPPKVDSPKASGCPPMPPTLWFNSQWLVPLISSSPTGFGFHSTRQLLARRAGCRLDEGTMAGVWGIRPESKSAH